MCVGSHNGNIIINSLWNQSFNTGPYYRLVQQLKQLIYFNISIHLQQTADAFYETQSSFRT